MCIGWKEERGVEPLTMDLQQVVELIAQDDAEVAVETGIMVKDLAQYEAEVLDPALEVQMAARLSTLVPGLKERGTEGVRQARKGLRMLRKGDDAVMHVSFVK